MPKPLQLPNLFLPRQRREQAPAESTEPFLDLDIFCRRHFFAEDRLQEQFVADVFPQAAVGFELRLAEKLIGRRLMRENRVIDPVASNELAFVAGERELQVEEITTDFFRAALVPWIADAAKTKVRPAQAAVVQAEIVEVNVNRDPEIDE